MPINFSGATAFNTERGTIQIELPDNKQYTLDLNVVYAYNITNVTFYSLSGNGYVSVLVGSTPLTQVNNLTFNQTISSVTVNTGNGVSVGSSVYAQVSGNNFGSDLIIGITYVRQ